MTHFTFCPTIGGVETHLLDLSTALILRGHTVHVLVGSLGLEPRSFGIAGICVQRVEWLNPQLMRKRKMSAGVAVDAIWPELVDTIREGYRTFVVDHDIDLVHAHDLERLMPEYGLALTATCRELGVRTLLTNHTAPDCASSSELLPPNQWDLVTQLGEQGNHAPSDCQDTALMVSHGVHPERFHPGLTGRRLKHRLGLDDRRVMLHPARLLPDKGAHLAIRALAQIAGEFPDAVLVIADTREILDWHDASAAYRDQVFQLIQQEGMQGRVVLRAFDYLRELPQAYAMAELVVYPTSGDEPQGLVPLEAMASATPVVATKRRGTADTVVDGVTGFIVPQGDVGQLAERMAALLRQPSLAHELGEAGRQHVMEHYTRARMSRRMVRLYKSVQRAA